MLLKLQNITLFLLLSLVFIFLFWGTKTYSEKHRLNAEQELDRVHRELTAVLEDSEVSYLFPLDRRTVLQEYAAFNVSPRFPNLYHAAIDYHVQAGSPVYAVADGNVSYSGEQEEHLGLVIIDHYKEGLHSLYGHLSTKQAVVTQGPVKRGAIIGYVAEPMIHEGDSRVPHLHFALRLGIKSDYPESGEGRWMAGYTSAMPVFHGFIDPERFIMQTIQWDKWTLQER
ncbi:M23 family metallopeptidase [Vibrio sp. IRLE0018]|uniref:M23 family metallopeptidase n=1 Tax=Vibrio TaxID=662 RepID=UPI0015940FB3|nr:MULTISPECIES: M23 family metallopeptidase [Vibrio]MCF8777667.1 M23 family metallopeptidase [Vibrio floridensis]NVC61647.1 M23 family metallopeptidase [Vibrio sp. 05-20-BW147]HAS6346817.1 peptidoglycan DD-metalloendopeptidase family protein [Vibrio vulnificus]